MKRIWIATLCLFGALQLSAQEPLRDWANFGKYEQENAAIKQPVKVVFMGNSITEEQLCGKRHWRTSFCSNADAFPSGCD